MNLKSLRQWEIRLGVTHVVILLGLVTGSMACSFYFGFFTGQDTGFERAYAAGIANAPRLPIAVNELPPGSSREAVSEVYARLHDDHVAGSDDLELADAPEVKLGGSDELVEIKPLESAPLVQEEVAPRADDTTLAREDAAAPILDRASKPERGSEATLGKLRASEERQRGAPIIEMRKNEVVRGSSESAKSSTASVKSASKSAPRGEEDSTAKVSKRDTSLVRTILPKGWFAQVAAPSKRADAESMARRLKSAGFPVMIENANVRGQEYFRVLVGPEDSRTQGDRLVAQLKRERAVSGEPFLRLVK